MLDGLLRERDPSLSWAAARALVETGKVFYNGRPCLDPQGRVREGDTIEVRPNAPRPSAHGRLEPADFVYVDRQVAVVRKPAGMNTVPYEPGERGTLDEAVRVALDQRARGRGGPAQGWIGVVHRLDRNTTGLLVFARTLAAKRHLGNQFRLHTVERRYVAIVHGRAESQTIRSRLVADRGDGLRGSTRLPKAGQEAITHVEALEHFGDASLVACRLETGRTHQIRIHLSEAGHPLAGEDVYVRNYRGERVAAPRPMLHAEELGFTHPETGEAMFFDDPWPDDFAEVVERLRASAPPREMGRGRHEAPADTGRGRREAPADMGRSHREAPADTGRGRREAPAPRAQGSRHSGAPADRGPRTPGPPRRPRQGR
jgi:23S rRNA pseudouridine1911/1915/1917 synthase